MNYFYLLLGLLLSLLILRDIVITTLSLQGGGRLTNFITQKAWQLLLKLSGNSGKKPFLIHAGYMILLLILLVWISGLWFGFYFIFLADADAIVSSTTRQPVDALKIFYYVGYTLSTMGNGEYIPATDAWRVLTNLASFTGLIFITMSITYFIPLLSAVILQEGLGVYINSMGETPEDILVNGWDGESFIRLLSRLSDVYQKLIQHTQNHQAYPIIFFFHSSDRDRSAIVNLSKLNEALGLLRHVVRREAFPGDKELLTLEKTLEFYTRIASNYSVLKKHPIPQPDLEKMERSGIPVDYASLKQFTDDHDQVERRKVFSNLLIDSGWNWEEVYGKTDKHY